MKKEVLLVDDHLFFFDSFIGLLSRSGFMVHCAENTASAIKALCTRQFNAIIIDCHMPSENEQLDSAQTGIRLADDIRSGRYSILDHNRKIPIIMLSGYDSDEAIFFAQRTDLDAFFRKPTRPSTIIKYLLSVT